MTGLRGERPRERLSWTQARRIALRAQGLGRPRPAEPLTRRASREALRRTIARTALLQIDSVSVFARAHHLPVYSRGGPWDPTVLDAASAPGPRRELVESLAHEAAYTTPRVHELLAARRARVAQRDWGAVRRAAQGDPHLIQRVLDHVAATGPISAAAVTRDLGDADRGDGWGWRRTRTQWVLEYLFRSGRLDCVGRSAQFERLYVLAPEPAGPPIPEAEAVRELVSIASRALGVASEADIADYFRLPRAPVRTALDALRGDGEVRDVLLRRGAQDVPLLLHRDAPGASPLRSAALLSPFDPAIFHRPRLSQMFDVEYRIGIYTPRERRTHGYYALPFLLGDRIVARADLRADRARGVLEVCEVHREALPDLGVRSGAGEEEIAHALAGELRRAAVWQGLDEIAVLPRGDLSTALAAALPATSA